MSISRRNFLKSSITCLAGGLSSGLLRVGETSSYAYSADYKSVVCINLEGGNDGVNMFIPNDDARYIEYAQAREELALARNNLIPVQSSKLHEPFSFHMSMPNIASLFSRKKLAILANVGTLTTPATSKQFRESANELPEYLFAHNAQQNQWQSPGTTHTSNVSSGWGGGMADALQSLNSGALYPTAVSLAGVNRYCMGIKTKPASVNPYLLSGLSGFREREFDYRRLQAMRDLRNADNNISLIAEASEATRRVIDESSVFKKYINSMPSLRTSFPNTKLGMQLHQVARIIQARWILGLNRQIFYVSLQGFDTHTNQLQTHARLLSEVDAAMSAFYRATEELNVESNVLSFTMSDFGRTVKPANGGSDHAWGNHQIIMGGSVNGGEVYGKLPSLVIGGVDDVGMKGRLIPTTSVEQYAATIAGWMGVSQPDINILFPNLVNFETQHLGFV